MIASDINLIPSLEITVQRNCAIFYILSYNSMLISQTKKLFFFSDMAQAVLQVPGLRDDPQHANVQRFQQTALLRGVSLSPRHCAR